MKWLLILAATLSLHCAQRGNTNLQITVIPSNPIMIDVGGTTTVNTFQLAPPYFTLSQMNVLWTGGGTAKIIAIEMKTPKSSTTSDTAPVTVECALSGDDLKVVFPTANLDATTGTIQITQGASAVVTKAFGCGGISVPNPKPSSYNVSVTVKVTAAVIDPNNPNNTTGRAVATAVINVQ